MSLGRDATAPVEVSAAPPDGSASDSDGDALTPSPPPPATARGLIAAALAGSLIDYPTSLLYRAQAFVGDPRLPEGLRGVSSCLEDLSLPSEIEKTLPSIRPELSDQLRPFTLRPNHPESIYNAMPVQEASARGNARANGVASCSGAAPTTGRGAWVSVPVVPYPVRVWYPCTGSIVDEMNAAEEADQVMATIAQIWTPMLEHMGPPIQDAGGPDEGGDSSIDVYLVDTFVPVHRGGQDVNLPWRARGMVEPSPPTQGLARSGYLLLPRSLLGEADFHSTVIHELFHLLQYAHNYDGLMDMSIAGHTNTESKYWFIEASAAWAMVHFDRVIGWSTREAKAIHEELFHAFQKSREALHIERQDEHAYEPYIWPFFMEQTAGESSIATAWRALALVNKDWNAANLALSNVVSFEKRFHDFTVRNINDEFLPGDPLPLSERYIGLDKIFPDKMKIQPRTKELLAPGETVRTEVMLPPLGSDYHEYFINDLLADNPPGPSEIHQIVVDYSSLSPGGTLDVDALVNVAKMGWELRSYSGLGKVTLCLDKPKDDVRELWLVLTNHGMGYGDKISGDLVVKALKEPCDCGRVFEVKKWRGTVSFKFEATDQGAPPSSTRVLVTRAANLTFEMGLVPGIGGVQGHLLVMDTLTSLDGLNLNSETLVGDGVPLGGSLNAAQFQITPDPTSFFARCNLTFFVKANVDVTRTETTTVGNATDQPPPRIFHEVNNNELNVVLEPIFQPSPEPGQPIVLSDSKQIPVRDRVDGNGSSLKVEGFSRALSEIREKRGETSPILGDAVVTWTFTQVDPPHF